MRLLQTEVTSSAGKDATVLAAARKAVAAKQAEVDAANAVKAKEATYAAKAKALGEASEADKAAMQTEIDDINAQLSQLKKDYAATAQVRHLAPWLYTLTLGTR